MPQADSPQRRTTQHSGIFRDPLVRAMAWLAAGIAILFLATVAGALLTGVISPSGPRTLLEKQIAVAESSVEAGSTDAAVWGQYLSVLIASEQYSRARSVLADARASLDDSSTAEFTLAEARLHFGEEEYEAAIESADAAMKQVNDKYEEAIAGEGTTARIARLDGRHPNYYEAALVKAYSLQELGEWARAVEQFDIYLEKTPTAADILVDRGLAKIEAQDNAGAEADLRQALTFIPGNEEALDGLASIGVTP